MENINKVERAARYLMETLLVKIEKLKKEKIELEAFLLNHKSDLCAGKTINTEKGVRDKISTLQMKINILTDFAEGKIDMDKTKSLAKKLKKIDNKIEYLKKKKDETQKELEKYPLLQSILFALM